MLSRYVVLQCCAVVALAGVATETDQGFEVASEKSRRLGGGAPSPRRRSSPAPAPPPPEPTFFVYQALVTPIDCAAAIDAQGAYLEVGNNDKETNWDDATFGHAQYRCLEPMIRNSLQYTKAISYAWCVYPHCEEECQSAGSGANCPVHDTVGKCQSAVKNWLGYAARKQVNANLTEAQQYYDEAISAWPENCGALGYRSELELQMGNNVAAKSKLSALCRKSACSGHDAVREAATTFWQHANLGRGNVPSECYWALAFDPNVNVPSESMAVPHHVGVALAIAFARATMQPLM